MRPHQVRQLLLIPSRYDGHSRCSLLSCIRPLSKPWNEPFSTKLSECIRPAFIYCLAPSGNSLENYLQAYLFPVIAFNATIIHSRFAICKDKLKPSKCIFDVDLRLKNVRAIENRKWLAALFLYPNVRSDLGKQESVMTCIFLRLKIAGVIDNRKCLAALYKASRVETLFCAANAGLISVVERNLSRDWDLKMQNQGIKC